MRLIFLLALKNLTSKAARTACSILAISVGLGTAIAIFTLDYNTVLSQRIRLKRQYGQPDLELRPINKYQADIAGLEKELQHSQGIKALAPIFFHSTNIYLTPSRPVNIFLCGFTSPGNDKFNAYRLVAGQELPEGDMKAILLTTTFANRHRVSLGESVYFRKSAARTVSSKCFDSNQSRIEPQAQLAAGGWGEFKVVGFIAPEHLGGKNNGQVGIIPFYAGEKFFSGTRIFPFFWVQATDGYALDRLKAELSGSFGVSKPSFAIIGESPMERGFRNGVHICGLFALGLGLLVVFSSFSMSLMERIKQIGLLRLVGATSTQICLIFLAEATIIAVIASILGLILGLGLTKALMIFRITTLGLGKPIYTFLIPWAQVLGIIGLGIIMDFWGVLYPMLKARNISPVRMIYPRESETAAKAGKLSKVFGLLIFAICLLALYLFAASYLTARRPTHIFILGGLASLIIFLIFLALVPIFSKHFTRLAYLCLAPFYKVEGQLAKKNIENSPARISFSICALMLVVAGVLSLKTMTKSMDQEIDHWAEIAMQDRAFFYTSRKLSVSELDPLRQLPMVQALVPMSATVTTPYFIKGVDPAELAKFGPFAEAPAGSVYKAFSHTDSLIISTQFARNYKLKPQDQLTLRTAEGKKDFRILAVMDEYGFFPFQRAYALIDAAKLAKYFCIGGDEISQFSIKLKAGYSVRQFYQEVWYKRSWPAQFYMKDKLIFSMASEYDIKKVFHDNIQPNFIIFEVILYMIVILIGIGTLNSLLISALERKKEIGLMRVVGMTADQISGTLLIEGGMIGLVSGILGVLMGLPLSAIAIYGLSLVSGLQLSHPISLFWCIISLVGAILVATAAGIYPAKKTKNISVIEAIRYE